MLLTMIYRFLIVLTILTPLFTLGQSDTLQKKKGKWIFFGKQKPHSIQSQPEEDVNCYYIGYHSDSTKSVEGLIEHSMKSGLWIYYYSDGKTIIRKETYIADQLEGPYEEYYPDGTLKESGFYENGKRKTRTARYYPSGCLEYEAYYDVTGHEDGTVTYYYDCDFTNNNLGQIEFVYTSVSGIPVGKATRYFENGDIKELIEYGIDGRIISREEKE